MKRTASAPEIAFEQTGGAGPRVLFIMGLGMRGAVWAPQVDDLGLDHQTAWFDNRGIGESTGASGIVRMVDMANDAGRVMDALGWSSAHVVGVSLGGMVAQEFAINHPARLQTLTLIATHAGGPTGLLPQLRGARLFAQNLFGGDRATILPQLLYTQAFLARVDQERLRARMLVQAGARQPLRSVLQQLGAVFLHNTRDRLKHISTPTLVIEPAHDILVRPHHSRFLAARIPQATLTQLAAGHGITFEAASDVNAAIRAHIAAVEAKRT